MQNVKDFLAANVPPAFKDARMTLESALKSTVLGDELARTSAYAVAVSLRSMNLAAVLKQELTADQVERADVAAAIMGMTNVYYSFLDTVNDAAITGLPAQLRMVSYGQQTAKDQRSFEAAALAVSIAGKCKPCIVSHVEELRKLDFTAEQFRDLARITAAVNAVAKVV
jgi:alkyl hydroperoxide reductase subunit D